VYVSFFGIGVALNLVWGAKLFSGALKLLAANKRS